MASTTTTCMNTLSSILYLVTLIGGVNWLVTGVRLTFPADAVIETASGEANATAILIPDALSWGGESFQIVTYYLVGFSGLALLLLSLNGFWVRRGEPLIACERVTA